MMYLRKIRNDILLTPINNYLASSADINELSSGDHMKMVLSFQWGCKMNIEQTSVSKRSKKNTFEVITHYPLKVVLIPVWFDTYG